MVDDDPTYWTCWRRRPARTPNARVMIPRTLVVAGEGVAVE